MTNGLRTLVRRRAGPAVRSVMVGRIERVQEERTPAHTDEETLALWYELGRAYAEAGGGGRRAWKLGLTVVCAAGALVLLSAPIFGTAWAGPFAPVIPLVAGLACGGGTFLRGRLRLRRRVGALRRSLAGRGVDGSRAGRGGPRSFSRAAARAT